MSLNNMFAFYGLFNISYLATIIIIVVTAIICVVLSVAVVP